MTQYIHKTRKLSASAATCRPPPQPWMEYPQNCHVCFKLSLYMLFYICAMALHVLMTLDVRPSQQSSGPLQIFITMFSATERENANSNFINYQKLGTWRQCHKTIKRAESKTTVLAPASPLPTVTRWASYSSSRCPVCPTSDGALPVPISQAACTSRSQTGPGTRGTQYFGNNFCDYFITLTLQIHLYTYLISLTTFLSVPTAFSITGCSYSTNVQ